ncbi:MAG: Dam family site-specific DNA-(adenine-N6)-methyltransferase [Paludibacteraceae bacterium]|nr:Dam family site-specific DNA-(adenine-N6)-methyltransferase [Paludibacteraceae bacterium]
MIVINNKYSAAKPFIKWVGGKGQLLQQLEAQLPQELYDEPFTYVEPFVGGGAMLFFMLQHFVNIKRVIINDINGNLTEAYKNIKQEPEGLVYRLKHIEQQYLGINSEEDRKDFYLEMRRRFNEENLSSLDKTALLIFLNRTCFNGLYRENAKGLFNVPFGRYANPTICNEEVIYADSELLNRFDVQILNGDFKATAKAIDKTGLTFFYFDPPYRPLSTTSSFNSYVKENFNDDSQRDLAAFCRLIDHKENVRWMLSNADCSAKNPADTFFEGIYEGFNIQRVYASRMVNANASKRGKLTELLIMNYESKQKPVAKPKIKTEEYELFNQEI